MTPPMLRGDAGTAGDESLAAGRGGPELVPYVWKNVDIQGGGFVTGLIFSRVAKGILYARTDVGGAYRWDPGGRRWVPITDFITREDSNYMGIESLATDPKRADRVYMAVGTYTADWAGLGAVMRSDDRGETWHVTEMPIKMGGNDLSRSAGERLAVDPHLTRILYFGSRKNGLWKSTDEADSFSKVESFPVEGDKEKGLGLAFVIFDPRGGKDGEPTKLIYVGVSRSDENLYRSTDAGKSWETVPGQPGGLTPGRAEVDRDGTLYVSYRNGDSPYAVQDGAVYRYEPRGDKWKNITPLEPSEDDKFGYGDVSIDAQHPGTLVTCTMDRWAKGGEAFRSTDRGETWKPVLSVATYDGSGVQYVYHHRDKLDAPQWMGDISIDPFDSDFAAVIDGAGVWATENLTEVDEGKPSAWKFLSKNLEETCPKALISPPEGAPLVSALGDICGFRHDDVDVSPQLGSFTNPNCANATDIDFAGQQPNVIVRVGNYPWSGEKLSRGGISEDGGTSWKPFGSEPKGSNGDGSIAVSADGKTIVWAPKDARVARSTDKGKTWSTCEGLPEPPKVADWAPAPLAIAADRVNPRRFYVYDLTMGKLHVSDDGAASFSLASAALTALPDYALTTGSIETVLGHEGHVWMTGGKELFYSQNSGKAIKTSRPVDESYHVGFGKAAPGETYPTVYLAGKIGGVSGVFRSDDAGKSFVGITDASQQFGGAQIVTGDPRIYGRVYIGAHGRGVFYGEPR